MQTANQILEALHKLGIQRIPLTRIYRCLYSEDLFLAAYAKIYKNRGALTPGSTPDTADGMNINVIRKIIAELRAERFRFSPLRRGYTDKKNGGKRALSYPNFSDKLVQEVLRMVLDAYYEPRFRKSSHGFRPKRGCHTALTEVYQRFRSVSWFIEGDIRACFDSLDHEILINILAKDIHDGRLLNLIRLGLQAGIVEDWDYRPTISGVPQGGIVSPILANIYLHELDVYIEDELIPQYTVGKYRKGNPAYDELSRAIRMAKHQGNVEEMRALSSQRSQLPSKLQQDPHYRRLRYVRYADDFLLGFIGSKGEAQTIKAAIGVFLRERLHLVLSDEKTLITHARTEHAQFLGYAVSIQLANHKMSSRSDTKRRGRYVNGKVRLGIPHGRVVQYTQPYLRHGEPYSDLAMVNYSDVNLIDTYQARFRGIAEYYKFAVDRHHLGTLKHVMQAALVKTLAHKYKTSVSKIYRKYRSTQIIDDREYKTLAVRIPTKTGERIFSWGAIPLKVIKPSVDYAIYDISMRDFPRTGRSDLIQRLQAETCELCGRNIQCEVHHVRKLANLKKRWAGRRSKPEWAVKMIAIRRKTLVVCHACHVDIHAGRPIPNERKHQVLESRMN